MESNSQLVKYARLSLAAALKAVALLLLAAGSLQYLLADLFMPLPFIAAVLLFALSFATDRWRRPIAWLLLLLSVLVPAGVFTAYMAGQVSIWILVFDLVVFAWLFWCALPSARAGSASQ